jgi:transcriptional regulator with XRE-family HTH domain
MAETSEFGTFFRETRKGLGLTLREFCRQNGFDPGNVSRLERGLTPPPQTEDGLREYAKALKLKQGSDRYTRFIDLATVATGRIPSELLENQTTAGQLPKLLRQLRGGPGHRNWITALHLDDWANTLGARAVLPQLVRRLIHATGKTLTRIDIPAGAEIQRPGLDGIVEASEPGAFVPTGRSVWEMGVNKDPAAKAEEDFAKRKKQKLGFDKKEMTYVVVTPRKWQTKGAWAEAKNKLGVFKEVRVYDSTNIEEWLERAPAVDAWLARLLNVRPEGLTDIDEYWENLEALTEPSLKPEVFLASRQKKVDEFGKWLDGPPSAVVIESRSPSEAIDFVAAVIRKSAVRESTTVHTVIVEEKEAWRSICRSDSPLVLIAHPHMAVESELVAEAVRQGHHVILSATQTLTDRAFVLELPRVYRHDLEKALELSGMQRMEASETAGKAGGSLTVLKRLLGKMHGTDRPTWCAGTEATALVPMLLVGAWEGSNPGDGAVLERLSSRPYQEVVATAGRWLDAPDSPLVRVLSHWRLVSRDDSWFLLSQAVTPEHLALFEQVAVDVLGENDPAFELPPDERWMASIKDQVLRHSRSLRTGMSETLALLGARPERLPNSPDAPGLVSHIVRRLLDRTVWDRWASLSPQLPLLAEAAPDAFLKAVEQGLREKEPVLRKLFEQEGRSALFSSTPHVGLLWALEGLAWDRGHLPRVSYALARLDELLAEKNHGNSPMKSLQAIFMTWYPQTTAPVEERVKVLAAITRKHPATGWRLLLGLLPERMGSTMPIRRPAFRDWALSWTEGTTNADHARQVNACAELLVDLLGEDLARWKELIEHFEKLTGPGGQKFLDKLLSFDVTTFDTQARRTIAEALREKVARHRRFAETDWALPETLLGGLEEAQKRFEPQDAVSRNTWLFNQIWEVLEHEGGEDGRAVVELRRKAIAEVLTESGWGGVLALAEAVKAPDELGAAVGESGTTNDDSRVLPSLLSGGEKMARFAQGYVSGRFNAAGWEWVGQLKVNAWTTRDTAEFALVLPVEPRAWEFVMGKGSEAEKHYWLNVTRAVRDPDPKKVRAAVSNLLKYGRAFQACFVIGMARHQKCPVESELMLEALESPFKGPLAESESSGLGHRRHYLLELIQYLQNEVQRTGSGVEEARVAKLEFGYLNMLDGHPTTPRTLHNMLKTNPEFFVDLLGIVYPTGGAAEEGKEPSEEDRARATNAFQLLMSWKSVPGSRDDKTVDETALLDWVHKARSMAEKRNRLDVCDIRIGNVLSHDKGETEDGGWPCVPVRDVIEEIGTEELANGFEVGIYNKRGAYSKAFDAGGEQERSLAKRYRDWAAICKIEWPKTAALLARVAEGYEREAARVDAEAELRLT